MEKMTNVKALAYVLENGSYPADVTEKLEAIKASFEKKSTNRKPTATQEANVAIKDAIKAVLADADKPITIAEIQASDETLKGLTNQKISALLTQMGEKGTGEVVKTLDKKKAYFALA